MTGEMEEDAENRFSKSNSTREQGEGFNSRKARYSFYHPVVEHSSSTTLLPCTKTTTAAVATTPTTTATTTTTTQTNIVDAVPTTGTSNDTTIFTGMEDIALISATEPTIHSYVNNRSPSEAVVVRVQRSEDESNTKIHVESDEFNFLSPPPSSLPEGFYLRTLESLEEGGKEISTTCLKELPTAAETTSTIEIVSSTVHIGSEDPYSFSKDLKNDKWMESLPTLSGPNFFQSENETEEEKNLDAGDAVTDFISSRHSVLNDHPLVQFKESPQYQPLTQDPLLAVPLASTSDNSQTGTMIVLQEVLQHLRQRRLVRNTSSLLLSNDSNSCSHFYPYPSTNARVPEISKGPRNGRATMGPQQHQQKEEDEEEVEPLLPGKASSDSKLNEYHSLTKSNLSSSSPLPLYPRHHYGIQRQLQHQQQQQMDTFPLPSNAIPVISTEVDTTTIATTIQSSFDTSSTSYFIPIIKQATKSEDRLLSPSVDIRKLVADTVPDLFRHGQNVHQDRNDHDISLFRDNSLNQTKSLGQSKEEESSTSMCFTGLNLANPIYSTQTLCSASVPTSPDSVKYRDTKRTALEPHSLPILPLTDPMNGAILVDPDFLETHCSRRKDLDSNYNTQNTISLATTSRVSIADTVPLSNTNMTSSTATSMPSSTRQPIALDSSNPNPLEQDLYRSIKEVVESSVESILISILEYAASKSNMEQVSTFPLLTIQECVESAFASISYSRIPILFPPSSPLSSSLEENFSALPSLVVPPSPSSSSSTTNSSSSEEISSVESLEEGTEKEEDASENAGDFHMMLENDDDQSMDPFKTFSYERDSDDSQSFTKDIEEGEYDEDDDISHDDRGGTNKVLGRLSGMTGGTTGVVLDDSDHGGYYDNLYDDETSSNAIHDNAEYNYNDDISADNGTDEDEASESDLINEYIDNDVEIDDDAAPKSRVSFERNPAMSLDDGFPEPTMNISLSKSFDSITSAVCKGPSNIMAAFSFDGFGTSSPQHKQKNSTSHSDESKELETSFVRKLYAHLLPDHNVDNKKKGLSRWLGSKFGENRTIQMEPWDECDPDETGYIKHKLSRMQLHEVELQYEHILRSSQHRLSDTNRIDTADKKRSSKIGKSDDNTPSKSADSMTSVNENKKSVIDGNASVAESNNEKVDADFSSDESNQKNKLIVNPFFPSAKPAGTGHAGDLEIYHLPIVYKAKQTGFEPTKDLVLQPDTIFAGQYYVQCELGSAAFSVAYRCIDLNSGKKADDGEEYYDEVCLKVIKNNKDFFDQSLDEIKVLELLRQTGKCHENNIVEMKCFFYHKEHLVIVTELLRQNLFEFGKYIVENNEPEYFTRDRLCYIARQCLIALDFIHNLGLIHSDVKPENILLSSYSKVRVKVIDFGSSCYVSDRQSSYIQSRSYRAPEVILGLPYDGKIDVWSLGCVIAEMYTGQVTFQNDSLVSMLSRIEAICGPFPRHIVENGRTSNQYFTASGLLYEKFGDDDAVDTESMDTDDIFYYVYQPKATTISSRLGLEPTLLERRRTTWEDEEKALFVDFVKKLLTIDPECRPTAAQALEHPWILSGFNLSEQDLIYPPCR